MPYITPVQYNDVALAPLKTLSGGNPRASFSSSSLNASASIKEATFLNAKFNDIALVNTAGRETQGTATLVGQIFPKLR